MSQIELTPIQTLLRESLTARINGAAEQICKADMAGQENSPMNSDPIDVYTAIMAQVITEQGGEQSVGMMVNTGALFVARFMKAQHLAIKYQSENEQLRLMIADLESKQVEVINEPE